MHEGRKPADAPSTAAVESVFRVDRIRTDDDTVYYLGTPRAPSETLERELWPLFHDAGYEVSLTTRAQSEDPFGEEIPARESAATEPEADSADSGSSGPPSEVDTGRFDASRPQYVLVAEPRTPHIDGVPWTNVVFFVMTVLSTLIVGAQWYYITITGVDDLHKLLWAWPFTASVLGVLAVHEAGHYVLIRHHDVDASLPYFIPFPSIIGTMGAVIRMRGRIPDRKALFDIGVAGPLAGLVATVVVTVVGLHLDPVTVPERVADQSNGTFIHFNDPMLLQLLGEVTGQPLSYADPRKQVSPVVFGGWVGMFVTFLNLLPVGQFDGGHIVRAMLGPRQETVAAAVPAALFSLAGYLFVFTETTNAVILWVFWGFIGMGLAYAGPANPIRDEPIDARRQALGVLTFTLGLLCFTPVPFEIVPA